MPVSVPSTCLFCEFIGVFRKQWIPSVTWRQSSRSIVQLRGRRPPKRMTLAPNVSRAPPSAKPRHRPVEEGLTDHHSGGRNQRSAAIRQIPRPRSAAELKRSSSVQQPPQKERETFHALKMQKTLSEIPYARRSAIKAKIEEKIDFHDFGLLPEVEEAVEQEALAGFSDVSPTPIQRRAIPALLGKDKRLPSWTFQEAGRNPMEQYLLAAETGSGKTLAYLLPMLDSIKRAESAEAERVAQEEAKLKEEKQASAETENDGNFHAVEHPPLSTTPDSSTARPKAIILLPTSELVSQVGQVVKKLSHVVKFRSALTSAAYSTKVIHSRLFSPSGIDVLISTPHLLASISNSDPNILSRVTHLVIDEADSLLDRSFSPSTTTIIDKSTPSLKQLILCSATIPRSLDAFLQRRFPNIRRLVTPNLHAIPRRVQLGVIDVDKQPYQGNRLLACADTIWSISKDRAQEQLSEEDDGKMKRMLVFVNEREKSQEVADYLASKGIDAVALNRDTPEQRQAETLREFTTLDPNKVVARKLTPDVSPTKFENFATSGRNLSPLQPAKRRLPNTKVMVATDLGSRGIDTLAVKHVILFDVPHTTIDFIHRLGRTGRMGRRGRGIVLVGKHDRKDVVREVREGMFKGQALI